MQPILRELCAQGFRVEWISDLYNKRLDYRTAIPILLSWLGRTQNLDLKDGIVRALSVKWARPSAIGPLIEEYRRAPPYQQTNYKWVVGNALSVVADDSVFDEVVELVRDPGHGRAREMLAVALGNMKNPRAVDVLVELLGDEEVAGHALMALGKLKAKQARPRVERFLTHPKTWVRTEAKRALAKIDKAK